MSDEKKVLDSELQESLIKLHEIQVEKEKADIRGMTHGVALKTELALEAEEIDKQIEETEDNITSTKRAKVRYMILSIACAVLCIVVAVARYIAW